MAPLSLPFFQDGALLTNNPTAVALHEARLLWGKSVPIQCIISLGTGKCEGAGDQVGGASQAGLKDLLIGVASSATDTEGERHERSGCYHHYVHVHSEAPVCG